MLRYNELIVFKSLRSFKNFNLFIIFLKDKKIYQSTLIFSLFKKKDNLRLFKKKRE